MKLTAFLLFVACMHVAARSNSQTVTLKVKNAPMKQVFREIQRQTGLDVMIDESILEKVGKVTLNVNDMPVPQVLGICLKNEALTYSITNGRIVVKPVATKVESPTVTTPPPPPPVEIKGRVIDSLGNPLAGASVKVKRTGVTTYTNQKGEYELANLESGDVLIISYVGFNTMQENVPKNNAFIISGLKASNNELDKVIIQAYGTTSNRYNVGSIATVSGETIRNQPVMNPLLALQGQVAGLAVNTNTGTPGARVFLQIRGQNTFTNGGLKPYDQPLFIIDGIPFARQNNNTSQLSNLTSPSNQSGGGLDQAGGLSPFNNINPNDIESITVLKDADATSIYGSEGSNGVILITTRKGAAGKITFNTNVKTQFNSATRTVKLLNTAQYLQLRKEAFANDGVTPSNNPAAGGAYAPDLTIFDQTKYTNWHDLIFNNNPTSTDINSSLSGGTGNNTFRISTGFTKQNVNYAGDYSNKRFSINGSFHSISTDRRLELDFRAMYGYNTNSSPAGTINQNLILLAPNTPDLKNPDGSLNWAYKGVDIDGYQFYGTLNTFSKYQNHNFQNSVMISYRLIKGLRISTNAGYNRNSSIENSGLPKTSRRPLSTALSTAQFSNSVSESVNIEPQLDYAATIGKGRFTALLGGTYKKNISSAIFVSASGYNNDGLLESISAAATKTVTDAFSIRRYAAIFGRLTYNYASKYLVSLTARRDGSSNFGPGQQFGNFGSVAGGWIFTEEKFVQKTIPFLSFGKFSASYGTSGSDGVGQYQFQTFWGPVLSAPAYQGITPVIPGNHYNPIYSWALKKSLNISSDLGFFKDRVLLNVTYYRNRESNQLASSPLPSQTGFTTVTENVPSTIQNKGWEFGLNTRNIQSKNFSWASNFNLSFNRNKLLSFPNLASSVSYRNSYVIGQPISYTGVFSFAGIDPATGLPQFYDRLGGKTNTPVTGQPVNGGDFVTTVNRDPDYSGGLGNRLTYKQFSLDFFLQFNSQMSPSWIRTLYNENRIGIQANNVPAAVLGKYWTKPGDQAELLKLTSTASSIVGQAWASFRSSDAAYEKVRYVRLKTAALAYNLPEALTKKLHMKGGTFSIAVQNLFVISNVEIGDPESNGNYYSIPLQRVVSLNVNFNF